MDTIKIFDLEQMNGGKGAGNRLKASMRATVSPNKKNRFSGGSRLLTINSQNEIFSLGYTRFNFAQNSLTGEVYIIFSKTKGATLSKHNNAGNYRCQKNIVVDLLINDLFKIKYDYKEGINIDFEFSRNLSKNDDQITYQINLVK